MLYKSQSSGNIWNLIFLWGFRAYICSYFFHPVKLFYVNLILISVTEARRVGGKFFFLLYTIFYYTFSRFVLYLLVLPDSLNQIHIFKFYLVLWRNLRKKKWFLKEMQILQIFIWSLACICGWRPWRIQGRGCSAISSVPQSVWSCTVITCLFFFL